MTKGKNLEPKHGKWKQKLLEQMGTASHETRLRALAEDHGCRVVKSNITRTILNGEVVVAKVKLYNLLDANKKNVFQKPTEMREVQKWLLDTYEPNRNRLDV